MNTASKLIETQKKLIQKQDDKILAMAKMIDSQKNIIEVYKRIEVIHKEHGEKQDKNHGAINDAIKNCADVMNKIEEITDRHK